MAQINYSQYVNPIIGTNGMGHTFPGACYPFGGIQVSPDTDTIPHNINGKYQPRAYDYCAGYRHQDSTIVGFSHTHFSGTGHSDLGDVLVMPFTGNVQLHPGTANHPDDGYRSRFNHSTEICRPGYYEVTLSDDSIRVQLTATAHCGIHQYTYPAGKTQKLLLDLQHAIYNYDGKVLWASLRTEDPYTLTGYRITNGWARENYVYFVIHFSKAVKEYGYQDLAQQNYKGFWRRFDVNHNFPEMAGRKVVAWFVFEEDQNPQVDIQVALSGVSTYGALRNLYAETLRQKTQFNEHNLLPAPAPTRFLDFDNLLHSTESEWERNLSRFEAQGSTDQLSMFYTSLYHTMINPSIYQDVDNQYRGIDHNIHLNASNTTNYTIFSLWDTYRAFHPLMNIWNPLRAEDFVLSMLHHAQQSVHHILPVWSHDGNENWCMIGYHGVSVVTDAFLKEGLSDYHATGAVANEEFSYDSALPYLLNSSNLDYYDYTDLYKKLGYVPYDVSAVGTSVTLENAYEDWTIYNYLQTCKSKDLFKTNSKEQVDSLIDCYRQRALNFKNVFDPETGFARARYSDGHWKTPCSLLSTSDEGFIEGNSWNYSFYVPHDVNGLIRMMGGDEAFIHKLDTLFKMHLPDEFFAETEDVTREGMLGGYVHGNEPSHQIAYLYMWSSQPWKTQAQVRQIMNKMYKNNIDGLCGNDDCGQMSAWYVFSALGFYPVCPGTDQYVMGAPYLPDNKWSLTNGKTFEVKATKVSDKNCYIQSVSLNGKPLHRCFITYEEIMNGGVLEFVMGSKPNKQWFTEKPYSLE